MICVFVGHFTHRTIPGLCFGWFSGRFRFRCGDGTGSTKREGLGRATGSTKWTGCAGESTEWTGSGRAGTEGTGSGCAGTEKTGSSCAGTERRHLKCTARGSCRCIRGSCRCICLILLASSVIHIIHTHATNTTLSIVRRLVG